MANHIINNIVSNYAREHDAMEWQDEIKRLWKNTTISHFIYFDCYV